MERSAFQQGAQYLGLQARAGTADSFEKLIQDMFAWSDAEASSNMEVLFPEGLQHTAAGQTLQQQQQQQQQQQLPPALPFTAQSPSPLGAAAAVGSYGECAATPPARSPASSTALTSPFSGLSPELLLGAATAARPAPAAAAAAAGPVMPDATAIAAAVGVFGVPGSSGGSSGSRMPPRASLLSGEENLKQLLQQQLVMQQAQEALLVQQQMQQQQQAVIITELQQKQAQQQQQVHGDMDAAAAAEAEPARKSRRGRPPKADGQYSTAYAALKKYRARKRNELEEMEAAVAAKLAQLAALQQENQALKHKQEALESTIVIQERVVAQLSALQVAEQQQQQQAGSAVSAASSSTLRGSGSSSAPGSSCRNAADDVSALLAAVTGEPQNGTAAAGHAAAAAEPDLNNPAGDEDVDGDVNNPDWAGISSSSRIPVQRIVSGPLLGPEQLDVHMLLDRYKAYVASAAAALQQLAALLQQQQPRRFPPSLAVPPAAVGCMSAEEAAALGVAIPPAPFRLCEFLALGNDERLPPALPAINLLTGKHESIEPQIWRVVASQLTLRPGQAQKLAAAWGLYSASLTKVNNERGLLMRRLQDALDTCHRSSAAADAAGVGLSEGGLRSGLGLASPNDSTLLLSDEKLLDDVLNQHEYWDLAEAIDANMAREDQIMILFDYAMFMLLDELQLAQVVVSSWPFFPLMGSICTWLLEGEPGSKQQQ